MKGVGRMGKDKHEEAARKPSGLRDRRRGRFVADWAGVDAELIRQAITAATLHGGALRFGYTRDGGAFALGVLGDGEPYTLFAGADTDVEITLKEIIETLG